MDASPHRPCAASNDTPFSLSLEILAVAGGLIGVAVSGITALVQAVDSQEQKFKDVRR